MTPLAQQTWRALQQSLSTPGLTALLRGLHADDPRIVQGSCGMEFGSGEFLAGDALAYALAVGDKITNWNTLAVSWQEHMRQADGDWRPGEIKSWALLAWWDCNPRALVFAELAAMVEAELERRSWVPMRVSVC